MRRKLFAILMAAVMVVTFIPTLAFASETEGTNTYTAHYMFDLDKSAEQVDFYYSDNLLNGKSSKYNNKLAIASMGLALAAGGDTDANIKQLLEDMGFENYHSNYSTKLEKNDNVCVSYAMKQFGKNVIVPVVVRGSHYSIEWVDNFQAGTTGDAKGYSSAASKVVKYVNSFIKSKKINKSKVKIWVVGYSRGGAIADLTSERLTAKYGKAKVYGYCFESPMTNKGNGKKANIHHVRNYYDGVTCVLPTYMGFGIAGKVNKTIGKGDESAMKAALKKVVKEDVDKLYESPSDFKWAHIDTSTSALIGLVSGKISFVEGKKVDEKKFWTTLVSRIKKVIPSRKTYTSAYSSKTKYAAKKLGVKTKTVEASFMGIMKWYNSLNETEKAALSSKITSSLTGLLSIDGFTLEQFLKLVDTSANNFNKSITKDQYTQLVQVFANALGADDELTACVAGGLEPVIKYLDMDFANPETETLGSVLYKDSNGSNINRLIFPHGLEVTMAWLMAE